MRRILLAELRKAVLSPMTLCVIALLLALNGYLVWSTATEPISDWSDYSYTRQNVAAYFADHAGQSAEEMLEEIDAWTVSYYGLYTIGEDGTVTLPSQEQLDALTVYTDSLSEEADLFSTVRTYLESVEDYPAYLQRICDDAEQLVTVSTFSNPNSFAYRNIQRTPWVYRNVMSTTPEPSDSSGILIGVEPMITTILLLLAAVLVAMNLTLSEYDSGVMTLIKPVYRSGTPTLVAKLVVFAGVLAVLMALFYGENLAISASLFGLGDLQRSLQSLDGYLTSPLALTAGQFLAWFLLAKYFGVLAVALLFFGVCLCLKRLVPVFLVSAAGMGLEVLLYLNIDIHSWLSPLRQINLAALLNTAAYFDDYRGMNLFGWPVNEIIVSGATAVVVIAGSVVWMFWRWHTGETVKTAQTLRFARKSAVGRVSVRLTKYELYKLFVTHRGAIILACLLAFQVYHYWGQTIKLDLNDQYYEEYAAVLSGELSQEKETYLAETREDLDTLSEQYAAVEEQISSGEISEGYGSYLESLISQKAQRRTAFERAESQYAYLKEQAEQGYSVTFVYDTGYTALLESESRAVWDTGMLCFALILALAAFYPVEESTHMTELIRPSARGKRAVMRSKLRCVLLYTALAWLISFLPHICSICAQFHLSDWSIGARSLMQFCGAPAGFSTLGWFIVVQCAKLLTAELAAAGILLLSSRVRQTIPTLLLSLLFLEAPVFYFALGGEISLFLLPFFTGKAFLYW